jgi:hypothetical protein
LQVNERELGTMCQPDVIQMLRDFRTGDKIILQISRQAEINNQKTDSSAGTREATGSAAPPPPEPLVAEKTSPTQVKENVPPPLYVSTSTRASPHYDSQRLKDAQRLATVVSPLPRPLIHEGTIGERNRHKTLLVRCI